MSIQSKKQPTGERLTQATRLADRLEALGFDVSQVRYEIALDTWGQSQVPPQRIDGYRSILAEDTTDEYFNSFAPDGSAPAWQPHLLAVGRCFTLSQAQSKALASITHEKIYPDATIADLEVEDGFIVALTLRFPQVHRLVKLHLGRADLLKWVSAYKQMIRKKPTLSELSSTKPTKGKAKASKPKSERTSERDRLLAILADL